MVVKYTLPNLHRRAAEYYKSVRVKYEPCCLADIEPQLFEFEHLVAAQDFDVAARLMDEIDGNYLALWGFFERIVDMRSKLIGKIRDETLETANFISLADTYRMMGR